MASVEHGIDSHMRRLINNIKILSEDEEVNLVERWHKHQDIDARNLLVRAHGKLVASMAYKFKNSGAEFQDLMNEGYIALTLAADKFDPSRKNRFSTYAAWWILSGLQDAVHRDIYSVKIGRSRPEKKALRLLGTARQYLGANLDNEAFESIAEISGCDIDVVRKVDGVISSRSISLNSAVGTDGDGGGEMGDFIEDETSKDTGAESQLMKKNQRRVLDDVISDLSDARMRKILHDRYLLENEPEGRSLRDIGEELGLSSERVRQIERDAISELKNILKDRGFSFDLLMR